MQPEPAGAEELPNSEGDKPRDDVDHLVHAEEAAPEKLEEITILIRTLRGIDQGQDWHAIVRGIAGGRPGSMLSRGQAEVVIKRLRARLAGYDKQGSSAS